MRLSPRRSIVWYLMNMDATPTIYNRAVRCGRGFPVSAYDAGGTAVSIDVTATHSDSDQPPPDPFHLEDEGPHAISISVTCRSTLDLHAFNASGAPVIYRIRAYHPGDESRPIDVQDLPLRSGTESAMRDDEQAGRG